MLLLSALHDLLAQVLTPGGLHTAVLLTPAGQLVAFAAGPHKPKDEVRVIVAISGEIWQETKEQGVGMVDSELGRILVMPIGLKEKDNGEGGRGRDGPGPPSHVLLMTKPEDEPPMLLALNGTEAVSWEEMQTKALELAKHLSGPIGAIRGKIGARAVPPPKAKAAK